MHPGYLLIPIFFPIAAGLAGYLIRFGSEKGRRAYYCAVLCLSAIAMWLCLFFVSREQLVLLQFTDKLRIAFRLDGMGKIFAGLSSGLWPLTMLYAFDYMSHAKHTGMFWTFFTVAFGVTMGIALSANLLTMYLFYEMLTLSTIPLVIHGLDSESMAAGRKYMLYSFGGAAFAFLGLTYVISHSSSGFVYGGVLSGNGNGMALVFWLCAFLGFGVKAAIFPLHAWLPSASVAPTPVTALLHSVAVVKAGAFAVIRVTYYTFGTSMLRGTWAQNTALVLTMITILFGSAMALRQTHFKKRLAYSTISNLSYILFAAMLLSKSGLIAAVLHMVFHSLIKIVAFFAAGAVLHYTGKQMITSLEGIGRYMPLTFAAFTVSALSLTGVPPLNGFMSKWYIAVAALENPTALKVVGVGVLLISALLTAIYMLSICVRAFFPRRDKLLICTRENCKEASWLMTVPMLVISALTVATGLFGAQLAELIAKAVIL